MLIKEIGQNIHVHSLKRNRLKHEKISKLAVQYFLRTIKSIPHNSHKLSVSYKNATNTVMNDSFTSDDKSYNEQIESDEE